MKEALITLFILFYIQAINSQNDKSNSHFYVEGIVGYATGSAKGITFGASANYHFNKNLLTIKAQNQTLKGNDTALTLLFGKIFTSSIDEYSLMYGRVFINKNQFYSISLGLSSNKSSFTKKNEIIPENTQNYIGFPFEVNIKWFISKKSKVNVAPGFKLYGNIAKTSYIGFGFVVSIGSFTN